MSDISIMIQDNLEYCSKPPFNPPEVYPELLRIYQNIEIEPTNQVYTYVRQCLYNFGLDANNFGNSDWNPFSEFIFPGNTVLIKPNLVLHFYRDSEDIINIVTHGSVIRPIIDYVMLALKGRGKIIVGDAPHGNADFGKIVKQNGLQELIDWYRPFTNIHKIEISLKDFRKYIYATGKSGFVDGICRETDNKNNECVLVDLKDRSFLENLEHLERLYGSDYNRSFITSNHSKGMHRYLISDSVIKADVVINVPKMKTHKKAGVTVCLKNLVGINCDKNYLAHYRIGSPRKGGDEYHDTNNPFVGLLRIWNRFSRDILLAPNKLFLRKLFKIIDIFFKPIRKLCFVLFEKEMIEGGNWFGNDTVWRMCADLNQIMLYVDKQGKMKDTIQRKCFCLIDGIIAGEGNGPMEPEPKHIGLIACGFNPFMIDYVCSMIMGFNPEKIKLISQTIRHPVSNITDEHFDVICIRNNENIKYQNINFHFKAPRYWIGKIERND